MFPAQPQTNSTRNSIVTSPKGNVPSSALVLQLCVHLCVVCLIHSKYEACTCVKSTLWTRTRSLFNWYISVWVGRKEKSFLRHHESPDLSNWGYCDLSARLNGQPPFLSTLHTPAVLICCDHQLQAQKNILSDQCNLIFHLRLLTDPLDRTPPRTNSTSCMNGNIDPEMNFRVVGPNPGLILKLPVVQASGVTLAFMLRWMFRGGHVSLGCSMLLELMIIGWNFKSKALMVSFNHPPFYRSKVINLFFCPPLLIQMQHQSFSQANLLAEHI